MRVSPTVLITTCGSGHFLLGAFGRLVDYWRAEAPGLEKSEHARLALSSIHGVDINPFAVAIAQFRLVVAALQSMGMDSLLGAPELPLQVYAGDSLLWSEDSAGQSGLEYGLEFDPDAIASGAALSTEDADALRRTLARDQYDVVVGNPPYITVKDAILKARYKSLYRYCHGKWVLTVPFMEQFHALAKSGTRDASRAGWVGQITSNSFMAREFGVPLVEKYLPTVDLVEVIDTSGAYIPGHGTPTVTLVSRNRRPQADTLRAVLGIQGEPGAPDHPAKGRVWTSIVDHVDRVGHEDQWITVLQLNRNALVSHPWSLQGGAAPQASQQVNDCTAQRLGDLTASVGIMAVTGEDSLFMIDSDTTAGRLNIEETKSLVEGDLVREWGISEPITAIWTYDENNEVIPIDNLSSSRLIFRTRSSINRRRRFGTPMTEIGLAWWEWQEVYFSKRIAALSIAFAFVATHNHFVLDRGGKV